MLSEGVYPKQPTDDKDPHLPPPGKINRRNAPFVNAIEIWAEVTRRLSRCKVWAGMKIEDDGMLVYKHFADGWELKDLSKITTIPEGEFQWRILRALSYCSGRQFRVEKYADFCRFRQKRVRSS